MVWRTSSKHLSDFVFIHSYTELGAPASLSQVQYSQSNANPLCSYPFIVYAGSNRPVVQAVSSRTTNGTNNSEWRDRRYQSSRSVFAPNTNKQASTQARKAKQCARSTVLSYINIGGLLIQVDMHTEQSSMIAVPSLGVVNTLRCATEFHYIKQSEAQNHFWGYTLHI